MTQIVDEPTLFRMEDYAIKGTIGRVTPNGRSAVAKLDHPIDGISYIIIGEGSKGRVNLMNRELFKEGARIKFLELRRCADAFFAVQVAPESDG